MSGRLSKLRRKSALNKLVDDFQSRLETCLAIKGEYIKRRKQVLRGFRISLEEGHRALSEVIDTGDKIGQFNEANRRFLQQT